MRPEHWSGQGSTWEHVAATGDALEHLDLLVQQVIEQDDLVLQLQARVVGPEELLVLLLQLLPHQLCEARLDLELLLQLHDHLQQWQQQLHEALSVTKTALLNWNCFPWQQALAGEYQLGMQSPLHHLLLAEIHLQAALYVVLDPLDVARRDLLAYSRRRLISIYPGSLWACFAALPLELTRALAVYRLSRQLAWCGRARARSARASWLQRRCQRLRCRS